MTDPRPIPLPRETSRLLGHNAGEQTLLAAYRSARLHHGWLISGPRGVGKATLAYRFARYLLSEEASGGPEAGDLFGGTAPEPDRTLAISPDSPVFAQVAALSHPDLVAMERTVDEKTGRLRNEIVVADVRRAESFLRRTSSAGGWRVLIIDSVDEMNRHAANGILKILEEPPEKTVILLVCHSPGAILPTIRSRCRNLKLERLPEPVIETLIGDVRPELAVEDLRVLARLADGSVGRGLEMAAQDGGSIYTELAALLAQLPRPDGESLYVFSDGLNRAGREGAYRAAVDLLDWWIARAVSSVARGLGPPAPVAGEPVPDPGIFAGSRLTRWIEVREAIRQMFRRAGQVNLDRSQVMMDAFLAMSRAAR